MHSGRYHIKSGKFPILPGEEQEVVNPRTFGKALAEYLTERLRERGYTIPSFFAEDFGWWIEIKPPVGSSHVALRRAQDEPVEVADFAISVASDTRNWSWKKLRFVDMEEFNRKLSQDVGATLEADHAIEIVALDFDSYPDDRINRTGVQGKRGGG